MSDPNLHLLLQNIQSQLSSVEDKLNSAKALNGGFEQLVDKVDALQLDFTAIKNLLLGDGIKEGVVNKVKDLEDWQLRKEVYLKEQVYPAIKMLDVVGFKLEQIIPIIDSHEDMKRDVTKLKYAQAIYSKVVWFLALTVAGVLIKAFMDLLVTHH